METVRLDFDPAGMKRKQVIALILNAVISIGLFGLLLLGRICNITVINAFYEIILIFLSLELTLTIVGAGRFLSNVRNTVRTIVLSEESITINDDTYLNSTDYDVRYIIGFGFLNMDISLFNVYTALLRVKDYGNNTTKTYWMGPIGDRDSRQKREQFKKALLGICSNDLRKSTLQDIEKKTVGDTTTIEFPYKKTRNTQIAGGVILLGGGLVNLLLAVTFSSDLLRMFQLCLALTCIILGIMVFIGLLSNRNRTVKKITVDPLELNVDGDSYPWNQEPQIKICSDPNGSLTSSKKNELANRNIYLLVTSFGKTQRYYLGGTSTPEAKKGKALLIESLRRNDPKVRKDTEE
ncbi:MAG: hypothetical protein J5685_10905 [Clostridiales bacterium]|nr:hypothetical protein [Clostridiales bacterium]